MRKRICDTKLQQICPVCQNKTKKQPHQKIDLNCFPLLFVVLCFFFTGAWSGTETLVNCNKFEHDKSHTAHLGCMASASSNVTPMDIDGFSNFFLPCVSFALQAQIFFMINIVAICKVMNTRNQCSKLNRIQDMSWVFYRLLVATRNLKKLLVFTVLFA